MRDGTEARKKTFETYRESLEQISQTKDIQGFISANQTGTIDKLPPAPLFRHYLSPEKTMSVENMFSISQSSSLQSIDSESTGEEEEPSVYLSSDQSAEGGDPPARLKDSKASEAVPQKKSRITMVPLKDAPEPKPKPAQPEDKSSSKGLSPAAKPNGQDAEKFPSEDDDTPKKHGHSKSLPFLAIEQIDSETRTRSGTFTMVNPLAAQRIIPAPAAAEVSDRIEIFRTLIQRNSSGQLVFQNGERKSKTVRESVWVESWVSYKSPGESWAKAWGTIEGGYLWLFEKPEDNLEPPGMNTPKSKASLRGCTFATKIPAEERAPNQGTNVAIAIENPLTDFKIYVEVEDTASAPWITALESFTKLKS